MLVPILKDDPDLSAIHSPEDWRNIQKAAVARGVAALVAFSVRSQCDGDQRKWCDQLLTRSWARHNESLRQLDSILDALTKSGLEVLALKGPILGRRHFDPPFLRRPSTDVDLAVRDRDLERAATALAALGFVPSTSLSQARTTHHHLTLFAPGQPKIELHTRLSHATSGIPVDSFFDRAVAHRLPGGRDAMILNPADELLQLLLHFASDRFSSFFHLFELRQVWRKADETTRQEVIRNAVRHRFSAVLWMTDVAFQAYWSERLLPLNAAVPSTWLQARLTTGLLHAMEDNFRRPDERTITSRLRGRLFDLYLTDSWRDACRALTLTTRVALREFRLSRFGQVRGYERIG